MPDDTRAARSGGTFTLDQLFAEHSSALLAYATGLMGGDRGKAEDIVQETLLRAWRHADRLDESSGSIRGWLMRVSYNLSMDAHRSTKVRPAEVPGDHMISLVGADTTDRVLTAVAVKAALKRLGPEHRSVILQLYVCGLTVPETAQTLGIPVGTVKSRAFHGLRKLRKALDSSRCGDGSAGPVA